MTRLRFLTDSEIASIEPATITAGIPIETCPTCRSKPSTSYEKEREDGFYKFRGIEQRCNCERQIELRKAYLLANIPEQYQRLNWLDYDGSAEAREAVELFLTKWRGFDDNGVGIEFCGRELGTGKTFAATHIGKELIKQNVRVYFITFRDLVQAFVKDNREVIERVRGVHVLILDEVGDSMSVAQGRLYADQFEGIFRHRTNWNQITLMTTNIEEEKMRELYPRVYSLIEGKQLRIVLEGEDARMSKVGMENVELAANGEIRPLT